MRLLLRFFGFLFAAGTIVFLVGVAGVAGLIWHFSKDLPDYSQLQDYEPPVMTRVHAGDGSLVAEYATQRRLYLPIQAVPKMVINAFLAAEDKNFYDHNGIDPQGILRAGVAYLQNFGSNRRPQGASTITQQVAKNFLLTNEVSFTRKIKEALLALKIERTYSKEKILELYLNEIYLGFGAYGVAAASLLYFDKSVHELTPAEAAYLAALPKAPSQLHPFRQRDRAVERRNYVLDQMAITGEIKPAEADKWKKEPLTVTARPTGAHIFAAEYFAEEVRRWVYEKYGEKALYEGGLSVRTTLDPKLQVVARKALVDGLVKFDESQGWRGPVTKLVAAGDWGPKLAEVKQLNDISPWRLAVVLETGDQSARVGLYPSREPGGALTKERQVGIVPLDAVKWAKAAEGPQKGKVPAKVSQVLEVGDVIYVDPLNKEQNTWRLRQVPEISGAMVVMDPWTGRVLAMVGGFSFDQSQFNRATQAYRQPGSSFKPFVYLAALEHGYTPSSRILDAPFAIDQGPGLGLWKPGNYGGEFLGPATLRTQSQLGVQASWEIDLFGGLARQRESREANLAASISSWHDARVSLAAEVANAYVNYRHCEIQLAQSADESRSRAETARITAAAARAGLQSATTAQLSQAEQTLARYVGPLASVLVRRAAREGHDLPELYAKLAEQVTDPRARDLFLGQASVATGGSVRTSAGTTGAKPGTAAGSTDTV